MINVPITAIRLICERLSCFKSPYKFGLSRKLPTVNNIRHQTKTKPESVIILPKIAVSPHNKTEICSCKYAVFTAEDTVLVFSYEFLVMSFYI